MTWPFAKLRADTEAITITATAFGDFTFSTNDIVELRKKRGLFSVGLLISHANDDYPPYILFWTFSFRSLKHNLKRLGYSVGPAG